ncbi:membrane protein [Corynebacterium phocae]|uniref:Membrane protein n=1 Tax=Corynebacterium phocae TaxID=161895 RepID=A0A1L7D6N2_9CORY|nr:MFS transporter [Corynebacterium phocae]APT93809.1 membrane protein [Corynebacterium phocae]KAA8721138.1 MFS transporter [Corynebacterium phocae]
MSRNRRATLAMLFVGMAVFSGLYTTQAMLPVLVDALGLSSAQAALTVSAATGGLALCVVPASILSERFGRGRVLIISALAAAGLGLVVPFAHTGWQLIFLRGAQGAVMAGAPATAMAWLAEELDSRALPKAMGIYVAGTSVGGLTGRLIPTAVAEVSDWRGALWASAAASLLFALIVALLLPPQEHFRPKKIRVGTETQALLAHWKNPELAAFFITAFLTMGAFVSLYNFIGFRLIDHFGIPPVIAGLVFVIYLSGTWSSAKAGSLITRYGRRSTLAGALMLMAAGALATLGPLWVALAGLLAFTAGFFAAHSTASGWVGAAATHDRAEASSMYIFSYYLGSSVVGAATGWVFGVAPWGVFVAVITALSAAVALLALLAGSFSD